MKQTLLITTMIALIGTMAGCSKGEDKSTASVKSLLDQKTYQAEMNWCGQQAHPDMIQGCKNTDAAGWLLKNPNLLAMTTSPEPWPNKDTAFFQSVMNVPFEKQQLQTEEGSANAKVGGYVTEEYVQTAKNKVDELKKMIAAVPANALNAYKDESSWCGAQLAYQFGENPMFDQKDMTKISPSCAAAANAMMPGGF